MTLNPKIKKVIAREMVIFLAIIAIAYALDLLFFIFNRSSSGPYRAFWQDPYVYQLWNNSLRENAQIIRFLGYPVLLFFRLTAFVFRTFKNRIVQEELSVKYREEKVKKALEELAVEISLGRKIENVKYSHKHHWYAVRLNPLPGCIIPKDYIEKYINSGGKTSRAEIIDFLLTRR